MTRAAAIPLLTRVLIVPATRTVREIPSEVPLDEEDGMPATCALSFDNVVAVERSRIGDFITTLGPVKMAQVCEAWRLVVDC